MTIAHPELLFDRIITGGRAMMCSVLSHTIGNYQGMGDLECRKIYVRYAPPSYFRLFDWPPCSSIDMWRIFGRDLQMVALLPAPIIKPKLGLQPKPVGEACYAC